MPDLHPRIAVIIPVLNEESTLPLVLADIPRAVVDEVVVIDNGSTDHSMEVACICGATVLSEPRRGYGAACLAGMTYLQKKAPDILVFLDGDYSDHPEEISALLQLGMVDQNYGWTVEMQIKAIQKGLRIAEVPVRYRKRAGGASKVTGTLKGTVLAGYKILWTVFRYTWRTA